MIREIIIHSNYSDGHFLDHYGYIILLLLGLSCIFYGAYIDTSSNYDMDKVADMSILIGVVIIFFGIVFGMIMPYL